MIKQAIIPLAGLGTRLLPLSSVFAKELLPINGKPGIEYILDECIEAGIKEVIFIISQKKIMIKKYFYNDKFYRNIIKQKKDPRILSEYKKILKYKKMIKFVFQNKPLGTGDAVLKTKKFIKDKYFLMLLPDDLIIKKNCSKSMIATHKKFNTSVMASMKVSKNEVSRWGIYGIKEKIDSINFKQPDCEIVTNVTSTPTNNPDQIKKLLVDQIYSKVRWRETMLFMSEKNINTFIEIGPGKVLSGLTKRILPNSNSFSINSISDIKNLKNESKK